MASEPKEVTAALAVLDDGVNRCMKEDNLCTAEVLAALDLLAAKPTVKWPFEQFHNALIADKGTQEFEKEAKRRVLMASAAIHPAIRSTR
jgi:hypothetical protein